MNTLNHETSAFKETQLLVHRDNRKNGLSTPTYEFSPWCTSIELARAAIDGFVSEFEFQNKPIAAFDTGSLKPVCSGLSVNNTLRQCWRVEFTSLCYIQYDPFTDQVILWLVNPKQEDH